MSIEAFWWFPICPLDFGHAQPRLYCGDDAAGHLVLQLEDIVETTIKAVTPDMCTVCCINQLRADTDLVPSLAHRAFEHIAHAQLAADPFYINGLPLVCEARIARDH